ncbi:MAG TPA: thiol peroxidase [Acholeplasma sp.]|nr:thiol peroxidase [Acholeplasma sp.]
MKTMKGNKVTVVGTPLQVGDKAPDFTLVDNDLETVTLNDFNEEYVLLSVVPSLDTSVCDFQTRNINEKLASFENIKFLTVSMDLPFAQKRWCGSNGLDVTTLSDHRTGDFGKSYGALIDELKLLARSIFLLDKDRKVVYVEYLDEMSNHPNYDALLEFINTL